MSGDESPQSAARTASPTRRRWVSMRRISGVRVSSLSSSRRQHLKATTTSIERIAVPASDDVDQDVTARTLGKSAMVDRMGPDPDDVVVGEIEVSSRGTPPVGGTERHREVGDVDEGVVFAGVEADAAQRLDRAVQPEHGPAGRCHGDGVTDLCGGEVGTDLERSDAGHAVLALGREPIERDAGLGCGELTGEHGVHRTCDACQPAASGGVEQFDVAHVRVAHRGGEFGTGDRSVRSPRDVIMGPRASASASGRLGRVITSASNSAKAARSPGDDQRRSSK